jgi:tight adherence protein C
MDLGSASALGGLTFLVVGLTLGLGGLGLIWYSARMTREAVGRRVDFMRGKDLLVRTRVTPVEASFLRGEIQGLSVPQQREAARLFARFGVSLANASQALLVARLIAVAVLGVVTYLASGLSPLFAHAAMLRLLVGTAGAIVGWFVPQLVIWFQIRKRAKAVVAGLADALELLVICVEAGLSFEDGIDRIVGELVRSQPVLAEELAVTSADLKILTSRDRALANLAERIDMPSVRSVVTTLSQTMRYGTPLAHALRGVASELRTESLMKLEERANQLPTLMTIPMMIFIMPTIFLIVGGPAVIRVLDILGK